MTAAEREHLLEIRRALPFADPIEDAGEPTYIIGSDPASKDGRIFIGMERYVVKIFEAAATPRPAGLIDHLAGTPVIILPSPGDWELGA